MTRLICVGASAGGIEAIQRFLQLLPPGLPAPVFVVLHVAAHAPNLLAEIFSRGCALRVTTAKDGEPFRDRTVYLAPPDLHLTIDRTRLRLHAGPKENFSRPAIDPLFRSAALFHRSRVVGVVLSGALDDGTAGLWAIKRRGGVALVQDPAEASFTSMPLNAINAVDVDSVMTLSAIAKRVIQLSHTEPSRGSAASSDDKTLKIENNFATLGQVPQEQLKDVSVPASRVCAECGGPLWQVNKGPRRYRCHVGHSYTELSLYSAQSDASDKALWSATRVLEEEVQLASSILLRRDLSPDFRTLVRSSLGKAQDRLAATRAALGVARPGTNRDPLRSPGVSLGKAAKGRG